jgi:hypothetical protein
MTAEKLVGMYINTVGRVNANFTRQIRKVSVEIREEVLALIKERGLPPYEFKPKAYIPKTRRIKQVSFEQIQKPVITSGMIRELLAEVRKEQTDITERLRTLDIVDCYYTEKLRVMEADSSVSNYFDTSTEADYNKAHEHSRNNQSEIAQSVKCSCFHCCDLFVSSDIIKWADDGKTAVCPKCDVDAVIGDKSGYVFSTQFLKGMHDRWFSH